MNGVSEQPSVRKEKHRRTNSVIQGSLYNNDNVTKDTSYAD